MWYFSPPRKWLYVLFIWLLNHWAPLKKNVFLSKVLPRMNCLPYGVSASPCWLHCVPCWQIFAALDAMSAAPDDMLAAPRKIKGRINSIQERISIVRIIYTSAMLIYFWFSFESCSQIKLNWHNIKMHHTFVSCSFDNKNYCVFRNAGRVGSRNSLRLSKSSFFSINEL